MEFSGGSSSVVEHNLAKVGVAGSNPVFRSIRLETVPRPLTAVVVMSMDAEFRVAASSQKPSR